jgi:flagellar hook assembly protein FlgD
MNAKYIATIYTINGELVRKFNYSDFISNILYWDGKNQSGREVTADIYIIVLKSGSFMRMGKIVKVK